MQDNKREDDGQPKIGCNQLEEERRLKCAQAMATLDRINRELQEMARGERALRAVVTDRGPGWFTIRLEDYNPKTGEVLDESPWLGASVDRLPR